MSVTGSPRWNKRWPDSKCCCRARKPCKYGSMDRNMITIMYRMSWVWQEAAGPVRTPDEAGRYIVEPSGAHMRILVAILAAALAAGSATFAVAQHQHHHDASAPAAPDARQFVKFPAALVDHTLANMRDHLQALQEIQSHLGMGHTDVAAKIAETRLGMSSLGLHSAAEVSKYMPQGMQDAGTAMHRAASRFAIMAQEAGVTGDLKPVFAGLAEITAQCVGCHAGYRIK
jgi:hypothetical protein